MAEVERAGGADGLPEWVRALGITDPASGLARAQQARSLLLEAGRAELSKVGDSLGLLAVVTGLFARAQGLHEGSVAAGAGDNRWAAFTLVRAYAETVAALTYLADKPEMLDRFLDKHSVPVGRITGYAGSKSPPFRAIYNQLSGYAHPASFSMLSGAAGSASGRFEWQSLPSFRSASEQVLVFAWCFELARETARLLPEVTTAHLGWLERNSAEGGGLIP